MRVLAHLLWQDRTARTIVIVAGIFHVALWGILGIFLPRAAFLPLTYNVEVGINWTGPWWYAFVLPLVGGSIFIVNFILASYSMLKDRSLSVCLLIGALIVQMILCASAVTLVLVNHS